MRARKASAVIETARRHLTDIQTAADLRRERLSLSDYWAAMELMQELSTVGSEAQTFAKSAADFFGRFGFIVEMDGDGVNYIVSTR